MELTNSAQKRKNKVAVIYARFSSHNQTEQSIEGQLRECYDYAKRNNILVIGEYIDRALSGTMDKRPDFLRMIHDSARHTFDYVLVYQLDRFSRNRYDSARYKHMLKKNNVKVLSAREQINDDASGSLMESVLEGMAEYYSRELSQKVKRGLKESHIKGNYSGGHVLYGYDIVNKKFVINKNESAILKMMFDMYASTAKVDAVKQTLKKLGIKTKQGKDFTVSKIAKMFRNKKYIGICEYEGVEYRNITPQIIDEATFYKVNKILDNHKHNQRKDLLDENIYHLSGKLFCGYCGTGMTAECGTSKSGGVLRYYKCYKRKKTKTCNKKNIRKEVLENFVFEKTKQYVLQPRVIESIANIVTTKYNNSVNENMILRKLQNDYKEVRKGINALVDAIQSGVQSYSLQERLTNYEKERDRLEVEIAKEETRQIPTIKKSDVVTFLKEYANSDFNSQTDKNAFFNNFIQKIILYDDRIIIIYNTGIDSREQVYHEKLEDYEDDLDILYHEKKKCLESNNKKLPFEIKRQSLGGERGI